MAEATLLLTGKNGQLGFELQRALAPLGRLVAVDREECDLADGAALRQLVRDLEPQVIVNPAAYTAVDRAESEPEQARAVNAEAPAILAEEAARLDALLVHYSTDYVFDGRQPRPYTEEDRPNPLNVYGATKLAGEEAVTQTVERHLVLRTSWVVGAHGANFARTILRLATEREALEVVDDQWGAPTSAALLADVTAHLIRQEAADEAFPHGLYHLAASGETNWCRYARHLVSRARELGAELRLEPDAIRPIPTEAYPTPARRPANSRLDTRRLRHTFGLHLPAWQQGLEPILQQMVFRSSQ